MSKANKNSPSPAGLSAEEQSRIQEKIAIRAYELWQEAGCVHGNDEAHWLQAEREILGRQETV
jgi:hypothetical protein